MRRLLLAALLLAACDRPARVSFDPPRLELHGRGQAATVRAVVHGASGRPLPRRSCAWSSSDERVATVRGAYGEATVTAVGAGSAAARCRVGDVAAEAPVVVRLVGRVEASPSRVELRLQDEPRPVALEVRVWDAEGRPLPGRTVRTRCLDEDVCRGDDRGQLWAVGPGDSRVEVEVEGAAAAVEAHVVDARTAEGRPRRVRGNPMLDYEKAVKALGR